MSCHHVPEWYIQALSSHQDKSELVTIIMDNNINYPDKARDIWEDVWGIVRHDLSTADE